MNKVALLIGTSNYEFPDALKPLPCARKDVEALQRVLLNPKMGGFSEATPLLDPDPMQMQEAIETLFRGRAKDDLVLLFFSGHGIKDDGGELHFATRLTRKTSAGELIKATAVPAMFVQRIMSSSRSRRQIVVLDCCFSGAFDPSLQSKDDGSLDLLTQLGAEGRVVLTSSSSTQYSFEQTGADLSIYTRYLVEGIETGAADRDNDSKISARELHEYASDKVQETAPNMSPKIIVLKDRGFDIVIAKTQIADPQLKYRKEVSRYGSKGEISSVGRMILNKQRIQLGLLEDEAIAIEDEVLRPYRERLENLQQYREAFAAAVQQEYPLSTETLIEFEDLREVMGLRDQDVESIHADLAAQVAAATEGHQQKLLQYEQEFTRIIHQVYPLSNTERETLQQIRQSLHLSHEDVVSLENQLTEQRQQEYQTNRQRYEQEFLKAVQAEYPLSFQLRQELQRFQQTLNLKAEDVALIEQPVVAQKEAVFQQQQEANRKQQELEKAQQQLKLEKQRQQQERQRERERKQQQLKAERQQRQQRQRERQEKQQKSQRRLQLPDLPALSSKKSRLAIAVGIVAIVTALSGGIKHWAYRSNLTKQNASLERVQALKAAEDFEQCTREAAVFAGDNQEIRVAIQAVLGECQLAQAEQLAQSGSLVGAIGLVRLISADAPVYDQAQAHVEPWSNRILELAGEQYQTGQLDTAIAMAEAIPENISTSEEAQKSIEQWNNEWTANEERLRTAETALGEENWQAAKDAANQVTTDYWKAKAEPIIQQADAAIAEAARREREAREREQAPSQPQQSTSQPSQPRSNPRRSSRSNPPPVEEPPIFQVPEF